MKKILTGIIILIIIGGAAYLYFTQPPSAPSESAQSALESAQTPAVPDSTTTGTTYRISGPESKVEFKIDEILRNKPFTAVGTTREIAGDIAISSTSISIGTIAVNARTFKTDDARRDGAISRLILKSEDPAHEFIYFKPTEVTNLSTSTLFSTGGTSTFTVVGDLTISGVTKRATFTVSLLIGTSTVTGTATVPLKRSDYNLIIPQVPFVASVEDDFTVTATVVARPITSP